MIELMLKMLEITKLRDDNIAFMKGMYKLPENFREAKQQLRWQLRR